MERTAGDTGALGEAIVFLDYFKDLPDPRQRGKVLYPLDEVLLLCLLSACRVDGSFLRSIRGGLFGMGARSDTWGSSREFSPSAKNAIGSVFWSRGQSHGKTDELPFIGVRGDLPSAVARFSGGLVAAHPQPEHRR
jgi:hypothetical protein